MTGGKSILIGVPFESVASIWPHIQEMLGKAVARSNGNYDLADVLESLLSRDMQLWVSVRDGEFEACAVTQIIRYPRKTLCGVPFIAGRDRDNWLKFEAPVSEWARSQGCQELEGYARKGWLRVLDGQGWKASWTLIRKAL